MSEPTSTVGRVGHVLRSADLLTEVRGSGDIVLRGLAMDSRAARPGDLFLAWKGSRFDAHDFVASAVENGAVATVVERPLDIDVPQLVVNNGRRAAAVASSAVMGDPGHELMTVGVTGTNGKTTTSLLIRHLLGPEIRTAVIGTLGLVEAEGVRAGTEGLTTPGPVDVALWLRDLADGGTAAVVMEASSHALEQHRLDGVPFDIAVFTNLSQDHLDYHGDMGSYLAAKARLVELVVDDGHVVVNADEPAWSSISAGARTVVRYAIGGDFAGAGNSADIVADDIVLRAGGTSFDLRIDGERWPVTMPLIGRYNVENALGAIGAARAAGVPTEALVERLGSAPQVSGRLEAVLTDPFTVLIDFAHTPDALENALAAVRPLTTGRLIVVFGAGGDRDPSKRRPMGEAVKRAADLVVVTSDNPRTEDPEAIIDGIVEGLDGTDFRRIVDRREAIAAALSEARPGDTVVLAGKGHEAYQVVGTEKLPFDERKIARDALRSLGVV